MHYFIIKENQGDFNVYKNVVLVDPKTQRVVASALKITISESIENLLSKVISNK